MSLNFGSKTYARVHCMQVAGVPLAGEYALDFVFLLNLNGMEHVAMFDLASEIETVAPSFPMRWGRAHMREPQVIHATRAQDQTVVLRLKLTQRQLEYIEKRRDGGDLQFKHDLFAWYTISSRGEQEPSVEIAGRDCRHEINQSSWIKALDGMGYSSSLLVEIPRPDSESVALAEALELAKGAETHLMLGHYSECVVECRKLIEFIRQDLDSDTRGIKKMLREFPDDLEEYDKRERRLLLQNVAHHYTHPGAHRGDDFSRSETQMIYTIAMSLLSEATRSKVQAEEQR